MAMRKPGPYAPLYANYADDERIMAVGEDAELLYVRMLAYAARTPRTEGWIADAVIQSRLGILPRYDESGMVAGTDAGSRAGRLADSGLITRINDGYRITSWLKWNRSVEEMDREQRRDRSRKTSTDNGTDAGSRAGNGAGVPDEFPPAETDQNQKQIMNDHFDDFWSIYPRRIAKKAAAKKFAIAVQNGADPQKIIDGAKAYADAVKGSDPTFIAHPTTWLNQGRWDDEQPPPSGMSEAEERDRRLNPWKYQ